MLLALIRRPASCCCGCSSCIIIVQAILSWLVAFNVINTHNDFVRSLLHALDRITAPLYRPIRKILPDFGGLDFSPLVVLLLIWVLQTPARRRRAADSPVAATR